MGSTSFDARRAPGALAVALLALGPRTGAAQPVALEAARLEFVVFDAARALPFSPILVGHELRRGLGRLGIASAWREAPPESYAQEHEFKVVLLPYDPAPATRGRCTIGAVQRRPGVSRAVWLMLPATRRALGLPVQGPLDHKQAGALAVALGRVVLHEVVHLVVPDRAHAEVGLMRSRLDRRALVGPAPELDPETRRLFLARLRPAPSLAGLGHCGPAPLAACSTPLAFR